MDLVHFMTFRRSHGVEPELKRLGIDYRVSPRNDGNDVFHFSILQSDSRWETIWMLLPEYWRTSHFMYQTIYSDVEIRSSPWLRIRVLNERGYPAPRSQWSNNNPPNYKYYCTSCGIYVQESPYYLEKEPGMAHNHFMRLYWVPPIFCTPHVFEKFEALGFQGYERWPALKYKAQQPFQAVSQLFVSHTMNPGIVSVQDMKQRVCKTCGVTKLLWGFEKSTLQIRREAFLEELDFMQTNEWFGSEGWAAHQEIIISNRVAQLILDHGWKGVQLKVVEVV